MAAPFSASQFNTSAKVISDTRTRIGQFTADSIKAQYGVDIAFLNSGGIRSTMPASSYVPLDTTIVRPTSTGTGPYTVSQD
jgi:2',3'-cyclic-nucleotide 2'-phosphodiesterase (5'-nucleotidase family)